MARASKKMGDEMNSQIKQGVQSLHMLSLSVLIGLIGANASFAEGRIDSQGGDGYPCSPYWKIPQVCGKSFWFMNRDYNGSPIVPPNIDRFPRLKRILENNVRHSYCNYSTFISKIETDSESKTPFFIADPRFSTGTFCDLAGSMYGSQAGKVISFRPRNTLNFENAPIEAPALMRSIGKGNTLEGWKSSQQLPQSILYDFYDEPVQLKKMRICLAYGSERKTHFKVELSLDGKSFETVGEHDGVTEKDGHEFAINKKAVFVRITVLSDTFNQAQILRTEFFNQSGEQVAPYIVSATSEALPLNPNHVPTIAEQTKELKGKYGERFLGYITSEFCNCMNYNILDYGREKYDPLNRKNSKGCLKNFPFRPMSPKVGSETYDNLVFAAKTVTQCYGWKGGRTASDTALMHEFHPFGHQFCEFGSAISFQEATFTNPSRLRLEYMFARSAARQYQRPWVVYIAPGMFAYGMFADKLKKSLAEKEEAGIYKSGLKGLFFTNTSASYAYRNTLLAFMMGCNIFENEAAQWFGNWQSFCNPFNTEYKTDPYPGLSPIGLAHIKVGEFALGLKDRGIPYTPLAFSIDFKQGISFSFGPWGHLADPDCWAEAGREYMMCVNTMETVMPWLPKNYKDHPAFGYLYETGNFRLANSPFGDVFDLLVPNPPSGVFAQDLFDSYKVLILLGRLNFSDVLTKRYEDYVKNGGTLLVNSIYLGKGIDETFAGVKLENGKASVSCQAFDQQGRLVAKLGANDVQRVVPAKLLPGCQVVLYDENKKPLFVEYKEGKGRVITCLVPEMQSDDPTAINTGSPYPDFPSRFLLAPKGKLMAGAEYVLKKLHDEQLPFRIDGDIEFLLNKIPDGWIVTLINNRGVYKEPAGPLVVDDDYTAVVRIYPKDDVSIADAEEILELGDGPVVKKANNEISSIIASVPPGDVRMVKISTRKK